MKVAVIGSGSVGVAVATGWLSSGHEVTMGVRNTANPKAIASAESLGIELATPAAAAANVDAILLAVPADAAVDTLLSLGTLSDQVVIDATNPVQYRDGGLHFSQPEGLSVTEHLARASSGARLVKTMNQIGSDMMAASKDPDAKPVMFIAGDDQDANEVAADLVSSLGFQPLMAGGLSKATHLEHLAMLWIDQAMHGDLGRDWGFSIVKNA